MRLYINRKILFGLFATILIILTLGIASFWYSQEVIRASRQGSQSQMLLLCSEQVRSLAIAIDAVQLQRAVSVKNDSLNQRLHELIPAVKTRLIELDSLSSASSQRQLIKQLSSRINNNIQAIQHSLSINQSVNNPGQRNEENQSGLFLLEASNLVDQIQAGENILKRERSTHVTSQFFRFGLSFFGLLASGMIILFVLIYSLNSNMKARYKAEEKLQQASGRVHDLYENAPCGYFSIDKSGMFTGMNQTLLGWLNYPREKVVHHFHISDVFSNEVSVLYGGEFSNNKANKQFLNLEATVTCQDKSIFPVILHAVALVDSKGQYIGSRCTLFDNTERKKAEDDANRLTKELEAFSYSVSHDLRAPLRSINGYTQILKEDYSTQLGEEGIHILNTVIRNSSRMGTLIDDLLLFSKANRIGINKTATDMTEFVSQIMSDMLVGENGRQIQFKIETLGIAVVDKSMIQQVWVNLLSNAIKYTRTRDVAIINVSANNKKKETVYAIKDNGVGFDMKYYDKLFGVFSRLHKQADFEGTGVGLALVQRIIERHNGRIWAEAKENEGAIFYFSIPKK